MRKPLAVLAVTAASIAAMPALASAKTLHLFTKPIDQAGGVFDSNGNPLPENQQPPVGSYFVGGDTAYKGTAKHHARGVFGYDHIICTLLDTNAHARCNANIVVRNGAIYATNFMLDLEAPTGVITTGLFGTGVYRHVKSITNRNFANGTSELVISY